jgi:cytochrome c biogenesis protein CcmG/thiol:disulfide interchange protein DsbE
VILVTRPASPGGTIARGEPAPAVEGTTLDGASFSLTALRGRPVILNFWGPSCVPCRSEFPLFKTKLAEHAGDGLALVGVLMWDAPEPAWDFVAELGATWPTVVDPDERIRAAYRAIGRPQTYFIDRAGVLRSIQVGELTEPDFDRQFALIAG